jgi:acyl-CoA thioester hydrolase
MSRDPKVLQHLAGFPIVIELPIQWGDQDAFGHVNNTVPLRWFESARIAYMGRVGLSAMFAERKVGPILASITANYRSQIHFPDSVLVGARVTRIGRSSMAMDHVAVSLGQGAVAVEGTSTLVVFDYVAGRSEPVPEAIRIAIDALEGRSVS